MKQPPLVTSLPSTQPQVIINTEKTAQWMNNVEKLSDYSIISEIVVTFAP